MRRFIFWTHKSFWGMGKRWNQARAGGKFHFIFVIFIVVSFVFVVCMSLALLFVAARFLQKIEIENTLKILLQCWRRQWRRRVSFSPSARPPCCWHYWVSSLYAAFLTRSIVPQALLLLSNIVIEAATLSASLDTTTIARVDLIIVYWIAVVRLSLAVLQPARIPAYAKLEWTNAGCPNARHFVTTWHRRHLLMLEVWKVRHSRRECRYRWACVKEMRRTDDDEITNQINSAVCCMETRSNVRKHCGVYTQLSTQAAHVYLHISMSIGHHVDEQFWQSVDELFLTQSWVRVE